MTTPGIIQDRRNDLTPGRHSLRAPDVAEAVRLRNWWKPKATNLLTVLYSVMLLTRLPFSRAVSLIVLSVVTILGIGGFGHVVNDLYDIGDDAKARKPNRLAILTAWQRGGLILGLLVVALLPWLVLPFDSLSAALLLFEFVLLVTYAMPPLRLKQRGVWAVFSDGAYAYALPAVLAAHTFFLAAGRSDDQMLVGSLILWQFGLGTRHYLNHLALDRGSDIKVGTQTLATERGNRYVHGLVRRTILPIEFVGFLVYLVVMSGHLHFMMFIILGFLLLASSFHVVLVVGRNYPWLTYRFSRMQLDWLYQGILPLVLVVYLLLGDWRYGVLLLVHLSLFHRIKVAGLGVLALPVVALWHYSTRGARGANRSSVKGTVEAASGGVTHVGSSAKQRGGVNIAVVNINKGKYTETFVQGLVSRLRYNVYYLYGSELPQYDDEGRHFLSAQPGLQSLAPFLEVVLGLEKDQMLKHSIASYLQARNIRLVLAEFGPVGNEMMPVARDVGIPLVVYFHGYDAFHQQTLQQCARQYAGLFRDAARIIGVSERMLEQLKALGAPPEKLVHLPAFVNLELFPYSDHGRAPPRFLAVGRFAETKSPHLTILAFHKVAQVVPQARLTMVGKGGGGELFEACVILVKALGLEDRVEFKGVLSHERVALEMQHARAFVQHSVTTPENNDMEGKPVAVAEAMASGLPVVSTRHSGIVELVEDEVTGLLVDEFDVEAMAAAMIRLAQDDALVTQLGRDASAAIRQHPLIPHHVEILERIIDESIARA